MLSSFSLLKNLFNQKGFHILGYIISINKCANEDLIVRVLTESKIHTLYRFYGARHSTINLGFRIDFSVEEQPLSMAKLRNILHMSYSWLFDHKKLFIWQDFIKLLNAHLKDVDEVENIYFQILESSGRKFDKQNPKRVLIEEYIKILENEGRLHNDFRCLSCEKKIEENLTLTRSFFPAHKTCIYNSHDFQREKIEDLFNNKTTMLLDDKECDRLWDIILEGI